MRRDERALTLTAHQQVVGGELVDRFAHRALAHLEARGKFHFARDRFAGTPFAGLEAARDQRLDLLVERAERRRISVARTTRRRDGTRRRNCGSHGMNCSTGRVRCRRKLTYVLCKT